MTTPDRTGAPEEIGIVEIFGVSFSTFTRTIKMGLHELGIHFIQVSRMPHSQDIKALNPYGLLPVLVHRQDGLYTPKDKIATLYESNAIRRYIDEYLAPLQSSISNRKSAVSHLTPWTPSSTSKLDQSLSLKRSQLDGFVSSFSQTIFPSVEAGFVKPASAMLKNGADRETILVALDEGVEKINQVLGIVEQQASHHHHNEIDNQHGWILGTKDVTWADLFLFPILDDLRASPLSQLIDGDKPTFPWLAGWMKRMDQRDSVKATHDGSIAQIGLGKN